MTENQRDDGPEINKVLCDDNHQRGVWDQSEPPQLIRRDQTWSRMEEAPDQGTNSTHFTSHNKLSDIFSVYFDFDGELFHHKSTDTHFYSAASLQ